MFVKWLESLGHKVNIYQQNVITGNTSLLVSCLVYIFFFPLNLCSK